ncbi:type I secretion system permease/ATPase [Roseateles chitinivorans]|uniref:type I secretion system permease/ATPase n=1 Tax=Roseateles chitinivorans TaxID=2917965 RepID=UPI003D6701B4
MNKSIHSEKSVDARDGAPIDKPALDDTTRSSALDALCLVARLHRLNADPQAMRHQLGLGPSAPIEREHLWQAARDVGLTAKYIRTEAARLSLVPLPALALMRDGRVVVLAHCDGQRVLTVDPQHSHPQLRDRPTVQPLTQFLSAWSNELLLLSSRPGAMGGLSRFDLTWFIPSLVRHRRLIAEALLMSCFLQLFALVSPLFFQVVMDKVLIHKGNSTLDVLVVGLVFVGIFESVLSVLRNYVFSHTSSRIDVELGTRLFRHLLSLPLSYFQSRRVGDSVARLRELDGIRQFLTGNAPTLVLDVVFSLAFIVVMLFYSAPLTGVVLVSLPFYVLLSLAVIPVLRSRLKEKFARNAENQALMVETVTGIATVKAGSLEYQIARRWDDQLASYVSAGFRAQTLGQLGNEGISLLSKLTNAATLWYGAHLVMEGQLTIGMFVAFNMFANRVAQPVIRIAQMWTEFQQVGISLARLADILDTPPEQVPRGASPLQGIQGRVTFERLTFRYRLDAPPVIRDLSLDVRPGEVIGIIGRSGSGKSTLTKLIQRLYLPERGRILVDGIDIAGVDPAQLRRQLGVVLQDNLLFNRSVRDNIAIQDPSAPMADIIHAARLAGAHEFITSLPEGYDTLVGEQGASLSGGQRQRIAIARALFGKPRILVLDEATSALDYESEAILHHNMQEIARGRTVFIIAHRLSAVRHADRIVAMEDGEIVETGTHSELMSRPQGLYARLWQLQAEGRPDDRSAFETRPPMRPALEVAP